MKRIFLLCFLLAPFICHADVTVVVGQPVQTGSGTDWTAESTMKALYLFETSPGINQDSKSTNHIDDTGPTTGMSADTTNYREGTQSGDNDNTNTEAAFLDKANMTADFPCNGTGDGEVTIAGWIRLDVISDNDYLVSIDQQQTIGMSGTYFDGHFNGSAGVNPVSTLSISTGTWYFVGIVYSDTGNTASVYVRALGSGSSTFDSAAANIGTLDDITTGRGLVVGALLSTGGNGTAGQYDAWAVFNGKAMSQAELDGVFTYGWDGNGW